MPPIASARPQADGSFAIRVPERGFYSVVARADGVSTVADVEKELKLSKDTAMLERLQKIGIEGWEFRTFPTEFWDPFGEKGLPVRATILRMRSVCP